LDEHELPRHNSTAYSDVVGFKKVVNVHNATRGLLIVGLILNSIFWVFLLLWIIKEFVPRLDLILRARQKLFLLLGFLVLLFATILLAISFLTYIGFSKAFKDDIEASGGTVSPLNHNNFNLSVYIGSMQRIFWIERIREMGT
jgi:hypothetical protein